MYGRSTICLLLMCTPLYGLEASLISSSQNLATLAQSFSPYMSFINWLKQKNYIIQEHTEFAQPVYQIKVQNQSGLTCAGHSLRNSLYLMDMLNSPTHEWQTLYTNMLDQTLFNNYAQYGDCNILTGTFDAFETLRLIKKNKIPCVHKETPCIPKNSENYVDNIFEPTVTVGTDVAFDFVKILGKTLSEIHLKMQLIEPAITEIEVFDAIYFFGKFDSKIIGKYLDARHHKQPYTFSALLHPESYAHSMMFVASTHNGREAFFFADSLNNQKVTPSSAVAPLIKQAFRYLQEDSSYFEKTYVRYNFFQKVNTFIDKLKQNTVPSLTFSINRTNIPEELYQKIISSAWYIKHYENSLRVYAQKLLEDTSIDNKKKELIKQALGNKQ